MIKEGLHKLSNISTWEIDGDWKQWAKPNIPFNLTNEWDKLISLLVGEAPIDKNKNDIHIWEPIGGDYTVKIGYQKLHEKQNHQE